MFDAGVCRHLRCLRVAGGENEREDEPHGASKRQCRVASSLVEVLASRRKYPASPTTTTMACGLLWCRLARVGPRLAVDQFFALKAGGGSVAPRRFSGLGGVFRLCGGAEKTAKLALASIKVRKGREKPVLFE